MQKAGMKHQGITRRYYNTDLVLYRPVHSMIARRFRVRG
jgi:hypothetical protein